MALSCHMAMDLLCQETEGCVLGELKVVGLLFRLLQNRMGIDFEHCVPSLE